MMKTEIGNKNELYTCVCVYVYVNKWTDKIMKVMGRRTVEKPLRGAYWFGIEVGGLRRERRRGGRRGRGRGRGSRLGNTLVFLGSKSSPETRPLPRRPKDLSLHISFVAPPLSFTPSPLSFLSPTNCFPAIDWFDDYGRVLKMLIALKILNNIILLGSGLWCMLI